MPIPVNIAALVCTAWLAAAGCTKAAIYAFEFEGVVDSIDLNESDVIAGAFVGQPISGSFCYGIAPNTSGTTSGFYEQTANLSLLVGATELSFAGAPINMRIGDDVRGGTWDSIEYWITSDLGDWDFGVFGMFLRDSSATALSSIEIPTSIDLNGYDSLGFRFDGTFTPSDSEVSMNFLLTSITQIPEPDSFSLVIVALVAAGIKRRRRTRGS